MWITGISIVVRPGRRSRWGLTYPLLAGLLLAGPAFAQATIPQALPPRPRLGSVVKPPAQVDPGMVRPTPNLPAQSTPVIQPRRLHRNRRGVEVVPK